MKLGFFGIEKLNFVEFNTTGSNTNYEKLNPESRYLSSEVFNLFARSFELSNDLYEYFGPSRYNSRNIVILQNELNKTLDSLININSHEGFIQFIESVFLGKEYICNLEQINPEWFLEWQFYNSKLIEVNQTLLQMIDYCIANERTLWVIGY